MAYQGPKREEEAACTASNTTCKRERRFDHEREGSWVADRENRSKQERRKEIQDEEMLVVE